MTLHDPVFKRANQGLARRRTEDLKKLFLCILTTDIFLLRARTVLILLPVAKAQALSYHLENHTKLIVNITKGANPNSDKHISANSLPNSPFERCNTAPKSAFYSECLHREGG